MAGGHNGKEKFPYTAEDLAIYMLDYLEKTKIYQQNDTDTDKSEEPENPAESMEELQ